MSVSQVVAGVGRRFGHGAAPILLALALVAAAVSLTACAGSPFSKAGSDHACADKAAQAAISGSVPGLWDCISPSLQSQLQQVGATGDHALVGQAFASAYQYLGSTADGKILGLNVGSSPS